MLGTKPDLIGKLQTKVDFPDHTLYREMGEIALWKHTDSQYILRGYVKLDGKRYLVSFGKRDHRMNPTKQRIIIRNLTKDTQTDTYAQENKPLLQTVCQYAPVNCTGNCEKCPHLLEMQVIDLNSPEMIKKRREEQ